MRIYLSRILKKEGFFRGGTVSVEVFVGVVRRSCVWRVVSKGIA